MKIIHRLVRLGIWLIGIGAAGLALALGGLWVEHTRRVALPTPTGPWAVGRVRLDWKDATNDASAPAPGAKREVLAWIWYPAADDKGEASPYLPASWEAAVSQSRSWILANLLTRDLRKVRAHSREDAALPAGRDAYPVVLLRGGGAAEVWNYTALAEDLASHGYVVVGLDAPYRTHVVVVPDGRSVERTSANDLDGVEGDEQVRRANRLLKAWTTDMSFALDRLAGLNAADPGGRFTGRLDLARVGAVGHSFGGAQAAEFAAQDGRCRSAIDIDGRLFGEVAHTGSKRPLMFLLGDHEHEDAAETQQVEAEFARIFAGLPAEARAWVTIRGANHFFFSDDGAFLKSHLAIGVLKWCGVVRIDSDRQWEIMAAGVRLFFDVQLKGTRGDVLATLAQAYPEVEVRR